MKRIGPILIAIELMNVPLYSQIVEIPDTAFLYVLIEQGVDINEDSLISDEEAVTITSLDVSGCGINDLTGIEAFVNLKALLCYSNNLDSLDLSNNAALEGLVCHNNQLKMLDISSNIALTELVCWNNQLTSLDVSIHTDLVQLECGGNQLTSLDVSNNSVLVRLECSANQLTGLDASNHSALERLFCGNNQLTSLDVSGCTALSGLHCDGNQLAGLDLSTNIALEELECGDNQLAGLDVTNDTALKYLDCQENQLTSLDISNNILLGQGDYQGYTSLVISNMPSLGEVCVWELPFPPSYLLINMTGSPNVWFDTICDGISPGIDEYSFSGISVYPNPTYDFLHIENEQPGSLTVNISSLSGRLIYSKRLEGTSHQIDLASFHKGVYFITIRSKDFVTTRKIIKL